MRRLPCNFRFLPIGHLSSATGVTEVAAAIIAIASKAAIFPGGYQSRESSVSRDISLLYRNESSTV
jgi:hypothetical protein